MRTYFVRGRNALVARAEFSELYVDHYLHLAGHGLRPDAQADAVLKEALAAVTLHAASRPWAETVAWTLHFEAPLLNVFVTAANPAGTVVGNVFSDGVREGGRALFIAETVDERHPKRRSTVQIGTRDVFRAVETYYANSEQRPARLFRLAEEDFVLVAAQPQCDMAWFESLNDAAMAGLDGTETLSLLEQRRYRYECGCSQKRLMAVLSPLLRQGNDVFGGEEVITVTCPRCGARHRLTREMFEAFDADPESRRNG